MLTKEGEHRMPRTYETTTPTDSDTIRRERSGVVLQFRNTPAALQRLAERRDENTNYERERDHLRSEMGFQKHRQFAATQAMDRILALELQAIEAFPIDRILAATDPDDNQALYEEIGRIENSYINQLITLDHQADAPFDRQRGLARLNLIKFFLSKTEMCYTKGITLNKKNIDDHILTDTELRLNDIRKQIRQLFNEAREIGQNDPDTFHAFKADLASLTTEPEAPLPTKAPELYKNRSDRREKPDAFVRRVYGQWLTQPGGLPRPVLRTIDEPCYRALYKHGIPTDLAEQMPTAQGRSIEDLARSDTELLEAVRSSRRQADNRRRKTSELAR